MIVTAPPTFTAHRAADLAGITYRQLDYWARANHIWPSVADAEGSGSRRVYSLRDVMMLRAFRHITGEGHIHDGAKAVRALTDHQLRARFVFERDQRVTITVALHLDQRTEPDLWAIVTAERFGQ